MRRGALNDGVKFYAVSQGLHGAICIANVPLAAKLYWVFPLILLLGCTYFYFNKTIKEALKVSRRFRLLLAIEAAVIWGIGLVAGVLPGGGAKESFVLIALGPLFLSMFHTSKEFEKYVMGDCKN